MTKPAKRIQKIQLFVITSDISGWTIISGGAVLRNGKGPAGPWEPL
jgi:hypothetical protein